MESGETEHAPIRGVLTKSWRQILVGGCSALLGIGGFYLITSFVVFYGTKVLKMPYETLLMGSLLAAVFEIFVLIWAGRMGEKYGASKVILWGGIASAVVAVPVFLAIDTANPVLVILAMIVGVCTLSVPYAVSGTALTSLFATKVRYTGVAITSNSAGVISGFVPLIATALVAASGNSFWPGAIILLVVSIMTALSGIFLPGTQHRRRRNEALSTQTTAGHLIVAQLERAGIKRVYGVPGESFLDVLDGLHGSSIETVVTRHEGGAGFMALAEGRLTELPGVAMVTRGPGAANAFIAIHTAHQDATPMILFVGLIPVADRGRESFQEFDINAWFGSTAKKVVTLDDAASAARVVDDAIFTALSGRPGPVVIGLPEDVLVHAIESGHGGTPRGCTVRTDRLGPGRAGTAPGGSDASR